MGSSAIEQNNSSKKIQAIICFEIRKNALYKNETYKHHYLFFIFNFLTEDCLREPMCKQRRHNFDLGWNVLENFNLDIVLVFVLVDVNPNFRYGHRIVSFYFSLRTPPH